jgi:hypothetical protein
MQLGRSFKFGLHDSCGFDDAILQIKHGHHVSDTIINRFGE